MLSRGGRVRDTNLDLPTKTTIRQFNARMKIALGNLRSLLKKV